MSGSPKFTPAPWAWGNGMEQVTPDSGTLFELVAYGPEDATGTSSISTVLACDDLDGKLTVTTANARLIAAAPELYEALYDLVHATNFVGKCLLDNLDPDAQTRILAVLAKARGAT